MTAGARASSPPFDADAVRYTVQAVREHATTYTLVKPPRGRLRQVRRGRLVPPDALLRIDTTKASAALCEWYIEQMDRTPKHCA